MAKINCDVDGVVCDLIAHTWACLGHLGMEPEPITDPKWRTWEVLGDLSDEQREAAFSMWNTASWWLEVPTVPYAKEATLALREAGHRIRWVTTAWEGCYGWRDTRKQWLEKNFAHPDQDLRVDLTVTGDKSDYWADVFIDDKPSAIKAWHKHHPLPNHRGILYKTNFNHEHHEELDHIEWGPESVQEVLKFLAEKYPES